MNRRREWGEQGFALIIALIIIILIAGLGASYLTVSTSSLRLVSTHRASSQALYVAETGLAHAVHELNVFNLSAFKDDQGHPAPAQGPYKGPYRLAGAFAIKDDNNQDKRIGDFEVELTVLETDPAIGHAPSAVTLKCMGDYGGVVRTVEANFVYASLVSTGRAVVTEGDLALKGRVTVTGDVHTNGALVLNGRSVHIFPADSALSDLGAPPYPGAFGGNLSAHRGIVGTADVAGTQDGGSAVEAVPRITSDMIMAKAKGLGWDVVEEAPPSRPSWRAKMRWPRVNGIDLVCPDGVPGKLIMIDGNVQLSGRVKGNVIVAATGNIEIVGNVGRVAEDAGHLMIVSAGNIKIAGSAKANGILLAGGSITARGNATVNGSIIAVNESPGPRNTIAGSLTVNYVRPPAEMENFFRRWKLITWRRTSSIGRKDGNP